MTSTEVAVLGAGPAGATAARLLAEWGHDVVLVAPPASARTALAESIPPSTRKILGAVGALPLLEGAGFVRTTGNTSWWGTPEPRIERFADGPGFQVLRAELEDLLLKAAVSVGVDVRRGRARAVRGASARAEEATLIPGADPDRLWIEAADEARSPLEISARHVLDASGRAGVLGRRWRHRHGPSTLAACAIYKRDGGFPVPDDSHTLVECHEDGWSWSVPVAANLRHVTVMLDPAARRDHTGNLDSLYARELAKSTHLRAVVEEGERVGPVWATDASPYTARVFAWDRWALVGDAGSFIDPLSSFGVKKALFSGWLAAVAAHTALRDSRRAALAASFFARQEQKVYATYARAAARYAAEASGLHPGSAFWNARASIETDAAVELDPELVSDEAVRAAFEMIKARPTLRLHLADGARIAPAAAVVGHEIETTEAVIGPGGTPVHFVEGVAAASLARLATRMPEVGAIADAYNQAEAPVALGVLLRALSTLVAAGLLRDEAAVLTTAVEDQGRPPVTS